MGKREARSGTSSSVKKRACRSSLAYSRKRSGDLASEDSKEKKERDAMMPANEVKARKKAADAEQQQEQEQKRKIPSLYRPGEKPADQQPPL